MFKMGSHDLFEYLKHKLWPKEGPKVKDQFDSCPLKVKNRPEIHAFKSCATDRWKNLDEGYNFVLDLTSIEGLYKKLWFSKVPIVPILEISKFNLGVLGQNEIWVQPPWLIIDNTIKGKVVVFPKFGLWWVLWVHVCSQFVHAPKVFQPCIN